MELGSPRKLQTLKNYFLFGIICFVLYMTLFDLLAKSSMKINSQAQVHPTFVVIIDSNGIVNIVSFDVEHKVNKNIVVDEDPVVETGNHVENDDKVTIAIVDQHQEGINCFFHNIKSLFYCVSETRLVKKFLRRQMDFFRKIPKLTSMEISRG